MIKKIIINADDFGRNKENNEAIIFTHKYGILSSTTVMTERNGFDHAVTIIKAYPNLKTGLHIDLDAIFIMREPNRFFKKIHKITPVMKQQIKDSINKQLDKFLKAGFTLSHLDSHHHAHMHPDVLPLVAQKAKDLNVPIRFHNGYYDCSKFLYRNLEKNVLVPILKEFNLKYPHFLRDKFDFSPNYESGEIMMHPGFVERYRAFDLAKCCDPELKRQIKKNNIKVISFADL
ncbi:MAG: ChbG/HpnK family deacetylase [Endomicrobium sp.]|jgi:predicted glycoside hydrolase/deacetylase ChbG (UPF0249 family)|nr:ChbG/HpnK family deacetylase [Endomicrobium sp.]